MSATPSPWTLDETWMLIMGPNGEEVCAVHSGVAGSPRRVDRNIAHENANLIAAAPLLLDALQLAGETIERLHAEHHNECDCIKGWREFSRLAIEAATGGDQ